MQVINNILSYLQSIEISQIVDLIIAIAVIILFLLLSPFVAYFALRIFYKAENKSEIKKAPIYKTIRSYINFSGVYVALKILQLDEIHDAFADKLYRIVIIWTIANLISGALELNEIIMDKLNTHKNFDFTKSDKFTVTLISKIVKVILYIIASYLSLKEFNYDLGGLATGLGIGGAIVALAAQNIVKQLLAGFAIVSDKPFRIGDWVEVNDIAGTVEAITWRSTRIKTVEDTIVTIDNGVLINSNIVNWGKIKKRIFKANLKLALETDERTVEKLINRIKFILRYDNKIIKNSIRVELNQIQDQYLNIYIYLETTVTDYAQYNAFCNKLNLTLLNILETMGVRLAYPGQNVYIMEAKEPKQAKIKIVKKETKDINKSNMEKPKSNK